MTGKITPRTKVVALVATFILFVVWFINATDKGQSEPAVSGNAAADHSTEKPVSVTSNGSDTVQGNAVASGDSEHAQGIKEERADLEESDKEFEEGYSSMESDSRLESLAPIQGDIADFLRDARALHDEARRAYESCIEKNDDANVFQNCFGASFYMHGSMSHFGIEQTLRELPNVSRSRLARSNEGWNKMVSDQMHNARSTLKSLGANQALASERGVPLSVLSQLTGKAQSLQDRANSVGDDDPVLQWILLSHADLLLVEFRLDADSYSRMLKRGKPLEP